MSDDDKDSQPSTGRAEVPPQAGVLGNLPRTRPAVRSPRRKVAKEAASGAGGTPPGGAAEPGEHPDAHPPEEGRSAADIEALAKGGLSAATGAASLGLRLASRAAAAVRDAVERR